MKEHDKFSFKHAEFGLPLAYAGTGYEEKVVDWRDSS